jgi:hypothetical protein
VFGALRLGVVVEEPGVDGVADDGREVAGGEAVEWSKGERG